MDSKAAWEYLGISERQLNNYVSQGRLNPVKKAKAGGGFTREFDEDELKEFKASLGARPGRVAGGNGSSTEGQSAQAALGNVQSAERQAEFFSGLIGATVAKTLETLEGRRLLTAAGADDASMQSATKSLGVDASKRLVLTLADAAELAGIPRGRIRAAIEEGSLHGYRDTLGRGWRVKRSDLESWVEGL